MFRSRLFLVVGVDQMFPRLSSERKQSIGRVLDKGMADGIG